jgi:SAM-dependent methyltransferase
MCATTGLSKLEAPLVRQAASMTENELSFSRKYDRARAERYFEKHQHGFWRRLNTWREIGMARRALLLAGDPKSVLDLPSGTGRFWNLLAENPRRKIYAADLNPAMFETGLKFRPAALTSRVEAFQASAFSIPKPDAFVECVFSIRLLHHIERAEDRLAILREFKRVTSATIIVSLWIDGNYRAMLEQRRPVRPGPSRDRYLISRRVIEGEFQEAGLAIAGRVDFLKYYSMWAAYVLKK